MIVEPFDPHVLAIANNGKVAKFKIANPEKIEVLTNSHHNTSNVASVSNNLEYFASASMDCEITVTRVGDKKLIATFRETDVEGILKTSLVTFRNPCLEIQLVCQRKPPPKPHQRQQSHSLGH
jgi:hypothetical protein